MDPLQGKCPACEMSEEEGDGLSMVSQVNQFGVLNEVVSICDKSQSFQPPPTITNHSVSDSVFPLLKKSLPPLAPQHDISLPSISAICRDNTVVASRCAKVVAGAGSVKSSAGT